MDLTTTDGMQRYLSHTSSESVASVEKLAGGTANYMYRLHLQDTATTKIIKHAEPHVASNPGFPFAVDRMDFEKGVLSKLPNLLPKSEIVKLPKVYEYDPENHVLLMEDGGARNLKNAYKDAGVDVKTIGKETGKWLACLHQKTVDVEIGDHQTAKHIYRFCYSNLASTASQYNLDSSLGERIDGEYGKLLQSDDECVCHGDFWPGNIIVGAAPEQLMVVDWEMVRRGCGATDVGQFAAESYLLDRFRGQRGLLASFLAGYGEEREGLSKAWFKRVAVHVGAHLAFWPSRVPWGDEMQTREVIQLGNEIMRRADGEDWEWFMREGNLLRVLVGEGLSEG